MIELQRYFHAAEEAAREIMLEEARQAQYNGDVSEKDGVFQLTTLSALPLKSPKRLIALQLANNNPAFRERFRLKLEQSGGPVGKGNNQGLSIASYTSLPPQYTNHISSGWGSHGAFPMNNDSNSSFEGELEKLINTPDWMKNHDNTMFNTSLNSRSFLNQHDHPMSAAMMNISTVNNLLREKPDLNKSAKKDTRGRKSKSAKDTDTDDNEDNSNRYMRTRQKRRKEDDEEGSSIDHQGLMIATAQSDMQNNDSSIIKRRRKGELQIMVDAGLTMSSLNSAGPLTNAIRANNLHSLMGGGISDMGPPGDTPRRSNRLKNGPLSTMSNLGTLNYLDSPFMEKSLLFSDGFGPFGVDTPSKLMHLDPPLSKTSISGEGVRFDFDEAVAAHFPSPRTGDHIKGSSPYRWSGGSVGSGAFFNFPDSTTASGSKSQSHSQLVGPDGPSDPSKSRNQSNPPANSVYAKKFKKALKKNDEGESLDGVETLSSSKRDESMFQSPIQQTSSAGITSSQSTQVVRETRSRANSKVSSCRFCQFLSPHCGLRRLPVRRTPSANRRIMREPRPLTGQETIKTLQKIRKNPCT